MTSDDVARLTISSGALEGKDKLDEFRETFGRSVLKIEIDPLNDMPLDIEMSVRALPGLAIASGLVSAMRVRHIAKLADNDDVVLVVMHAGEAEFTQAGRNAIVRSGEGILTANGEPGAFIQPESASVTNFRLSRAALSNSVVDLDRAIARVVPARHAALRLLAAYSSVLNDQQELETAELRRAFVTHMHDLAALAVGATPEAAEAARRGGLRAARLQAIKADILAHLAQADLSIDAVARRQGLSTRYVGLLFAADHTTFTDFVLDRRLAQAYRALTDWRFAARKISLIALESGIGDLSYFNRTFRRRYGMTPSDVRRRAWDNGGG